MHRDGTGTNDLPLRLLKEFSIYRIATNVQLQPSGP